MYFVIEKNSINSKKIKLGNYIKSRPFRDKNLTIFIDDINIP